MKISWKREAPGVAGGYVGKIRCFELIKQPNQSVELVCELPHVRDTLYGRLITHHASADEASKAALVTLSTWLRRLKDA